METEKTNAQMIEQARTESMAIAMRHRIMYQAYKDNGFTDDAALYLVGKQAHALIETSIKINTLKQQMAGSRLMMPRMGHE